MTTIHVNASVETHQCAPIHTNMIHTHASVFVSLMHVPLISTLTPTHVAADVMNTQPAPAISTLMSHRANATAVISRNVAQENTMTTIHVHASVVICQHAMLPIIMIRIHVNVSAGLTSATQVSTLTPRAVAVSVQNTRPAQTINTSMVHLASVNVK